MILSLLHSYPCLSLPLEINILNISIFLNRGGDADSNFSKNFYPSEVICLELACGRSIGNGNYMLMITTD